MRRVRRSEVGASRPEYSEAARPAQLCTVSVGQMGSISFPENFAELLNWSVYTRHAHYFVADDSSYNQSIRFRDNGENEVTAAARPRT